MNMLDGLNRYMADPAEWNLTLQVEKAARDILRRIALHGSQPDASDLDAAHKFLVDVETWKAMCMRERMGNAEQNSPRDVWAALCDAVAATTDLAAIIAIQRLKGFGSSRDEYGHGAAKVASAVLRFLKPDDWGVVDWRTAAMLGFLAKTAGDVDRAMLLAKKDDRKLLKEAHENIDEHGACAYNEEGGGHKSPA